MALALATSAGQIQALDVKAGDRILLGKWSGTEIKITDEDLLIMKESDVMGIIEPQAQHMDRTSCPDTSARRRTASAFSVWPEITIRVMGRYTDRTSHQMQRRREPCAN